MSQFSEKLKETIAATGMPVYTLAKKAGVNRPMIHKSQKGETIPSDDFIGKLSDAMMLTISEREELLNLAKRARMGETVYLKRKAVGDVLNCLCAQFSPVDVVALNDPEPHQDYSGSYSFIDNVQTMRHLLLNMLKIQARKGGGSVYFYLPEKAEDLGSVIYNAWSSEKLSMIRLVQIIGLEKEYYREDSAVRNLARLSYAINFSLVPGRQYNAYYHYLDYPDSTDLPAMPYYLKTDDGVLTLSGNLEAGIYYGAGEMLDFYDRVISRTLKESRSLVEVETDPTKMYDYGDTFSLIEGIPCIDKLITPDIVENLVLPEVPGRADVVALAQHAYSQWQGRPCVVHSFFQFNKLERFLRDGRIPTIADQIIRPMTPEERLYMLEGYYRLMTSPGEREYFALNTDAIDLAVDAEVVVSDERQVLIRRFIEDSPMLRIIRISEPSCVDAFVDFFDYLPESDLVLGEGETIARLAELLRQASSN